MNISPNQPSLRAFLVLWLLASLVLSIPGARAQEATDEPVAEATAELPLESLAEGPVTSVNGESVPAAVFQQRVRLTRFLYAYMLSETLNGLLESGIDAPSAINAVQSFFSEEFRLLQVHDLIGDRVLDTLERDTLLAQIAAERGLTVDDEAVDALMVEFIERPRQLVDGAIRSDAEATEAASAEDPIETFYEQVSEFVGLSPDVVRDFFEAQALREAVLEDQLGPMPDEWPFITVRHILVASQDEAMDAMAQLENGADFAELAEEISIDEGTAAEGGMLGRSVPEAYVEPFASAVRDAPVGEVIGPVETQFGYHVIEVLERETMTLDAAAIEALARARNTEFQTWLTEQMAQADIQRVDDWFGMIPVQPVGQDLLGEMISGRN